MIKRTLLATAFAFISTLVHAGDPAGIWQSEKDADGDWVDLIIEPCGDHYCGTIAEVYGGNPETVGTRILEGLKRINETEWSEGRIFAVDEDRWYDSKMELVASSQLKISGCVGFGMLCKSQTLTRLK